MDSNDALLGEELNAPMQPQLPEHPSVNQARNTYTSMPPILNALDWLLNNPSIPLSLRKQFFVLWEIVPFGNYNELEIRLLLVKFKEWTILTKWFFPDHTWGNTLEFIGDGQGEKEISMDLNLLFNMLTQLYLIQLTRGKKGFTVKEMTTLRSITKFGEERKKEDSGVKFI